MIRRAVSAGILGVLLASALGSSFHAVAQQSVSGRSETAVLLAEGRTISEAEASRLEERLREDPGETAFRVRLLGHYFVPRSDVSAQIERRREHILWFVRNQPSAEVAGRSEATLDPFGHSLADKTGYEKARTLWITQARRSKDPALLGNAAFFFKLHDRPLAEEFLKKAKALDRSNEEWSARLGSLYGLGILRLVGISDTGMPGRVDSSLAAADYARHAAAEVERSSDPVLVGSAGEFVSMQAGMLLAMFVGPGRESAKGPDPATTLDFAERALKRAVELQPSNPRWSQSLAQAYQIRSMVAPTGGKEALARKQLLSTEAALRTSEGRERMWPLVDAARTAFELGEKAKARSYANELLELAKLYRNDPQFESGHAIHQGHLVLGRAALAEDDVKTAAEHLLAAGRIDGCPHLSSFGPNMLLAQELLQAGEKEAVVEYLMLVKAFWKMDRGQLDRWIADVRAGRPPDFGANLSY